MTSSRAVIWLDHQSARVLQLGADDVQAHVLKAHVHPTAQHGSEVRASHEFFGSVCDAAEALTALQVAGSHTSIADFKHYVTGHRAHLGAKIIGYEVVDHLTDKELVALARVRFQAHDNMAGSALPR